MGSIRLAVALAIVALGTVATSAQASLFSTGFEAGEGYTAGTQLATVGAWTGDGQDPTGWQISNSVIGGSGPKDGSQWVLTSGATASTTKFQWTVTPVTDFSSQSVIMGSVDAKLVSPAAGNVSKSTLAGVAMFDSTVSFIGGISLIMDTENLAGLGANQMLIELDFGDGTFELYDLGVANAINQYVNLGLAVDFATDTVFGFVNGAQLPDTGSAGGATDFHDFDMLLGGASSGTGTRARGGFDNYMVSQVPEPGTLGLLAFGALGLLRRRR